MGKGRRILFFSGVVVWGLFATALMTYLLFPYERAFKVALRNVAGNGRTLISMEGVSTKPFGINAAKLHLRPDLNSGQTAPFELSRINIWWNPLSLLKGKLTVYSRARIYDGKLRCTVDAIPLTGPSSPNILLEVEHVNMGKLPEGTLPWLKGITGFLDGTVSKETPLATPDRQVGTFRLSLKGGEVQDLRVKDLPRLIIPYKEIVIQGKMDGTRLDITKIALASDVVSLTGSGVVESGEFEQTMDIRLSYTSLSKGFPLKGKGEITISGNQAAPRVTVKSGN